MAFVLLGSTWVGVVCMHDSCSGGLWGYRFLVPPSSLLRLNPSISIPKEGDNLRSPFQAIVPCDLAMLPRQLCAWRNLLV